MVDIPVKFIFAFCNWTGKRKPVKTSCRNILNVSQWLRVAGGAEELQWETTFWYRYLHPHSRKLKTFTKIMYMLIKLLFGSPSFWEKMIQVKIDTHHTKMN